MREINLLEQSPKIKRNISPGWRKPENRKIARRFGKEFFDGDRVNGYGGYKYDGRWKNVVRKLQEVYKIDSKSSVLDVGCGKGFLVYDLINMIPGIKALGIDISKYALNHAMDGFGQYALKKGAFQGIYEIENLEKIAKQSISPFLIRGSAEKLPWPDNSFDMVLSINTTHNLPIKKCKKALTEMVRVCKGKNMFIQVDSYRTDLEKEAINNWNLTAQTILHADEWKKLFNDAGYQGDYFWTILKQED